MRTLTRRDAAWALGGTIIASLLPADIRPVIAEDNEFKIGVIASLTGPAAPFFKEYVAGFQAYVASWNARGGVKGRQVALTVVDDETSAVPAANGYRRLAGDPTINVAWVAGNRSRWPCH